MDTQQHINKSQRLFIELGTSLRLESGDSGKMASSELIGMQVGQYLIVRLPQDSPGIILPAPREPLLVKYLRSGEIFGFSSRVILSLDEPDRLLFLEYPGTVTNFNLRSHERVECFLPVQIQTRKRMIQGMVVNINFQGCLCVIDPGPDTGVAIKDSIVVRFPMDGDSGLSVQGSLRSIRRHPPKMNLGIRFSELDSFSRSVIGALIPSLTF